MENANELPWEQNPYFIPALTAAGITTVGADASKAYPDPADDAFGIGATYTGATYAAGQPFVDGTSEVAPRHPINIFYNASTKAQEVDEYNTLYDADAPDSQCQVDLDHHLLDHPVHLRRRHQPGGVGDAAPTCCPTTPSELRPPDQHHGDAAVLEHPPPAGYVPAATAQPGTDGDGTLYEVLNPLISEYQSYFNAATPYEQLTLGGIGNVLADQTAWTAAQTAGTVKATEQNGVVTVTNSGTGAVNVPVTAPAGTTIGGVAYGRPTAVSCPPGRASPPVAPWSSTRTVPRPSPVPPPANSIVGAAFTDHRDHHR